VQIYKKTMKEGILPDTGQLYSFYKT